MTNLKDYLKLFLSVAILIAKNVLRKRFKNARIYSYVQSISTIITNSANHISFEDKTINCPETLLSSMPLNKRNHKAYRKIDKILSLKSTRTISKTLH